MTPRPPTPQAISALLKRAGFERAQVQRFTLTSGFRVTKSRAHPDAVRVEYLTGPREHESFRPGRLAAYAETITDDGWTVETGEYELTVTAGKAGE